MGHINGEESMPLSCGGQAEHHVQTERRHAQSATGVLPGAPADAGASTAVYVDWNLHSF